MKQPILLRLRRRHLIRAASFAAALLLVLGIALAVTSVQAVRYRRYVENDHQHAFAELVSALDGIDTSLQKTVLATSPALLTVLCSDISEKVGVASISLGQLPFSTMELEQTAGFISRVGDYVLALTRAAAQGTILTPEQLTNLRTLSDTAGVLAQNLSQMQTELLAGSLSLEELKQTGNLMSQTENALPTVSDSLSDMEQEFPEIPALIYDGPFSQHVEQSVPAMLEGQPMLEEEEVRKRVAEFFSLRPEAFEAAGESQGDIPTYFFTARVDGGEMYVEAAQQGGYVLAMMNSRSVAEQTLSVEAGLNRAQQFLEDNGLTGLVHSYYRLVDNVLTVNFAHQQGDVICYPDLIKVAVALDTGRIVGYEALGYLSSHRERTLPQITVPEEQARQALSSELELLSHQMAIIPSAGGEELLCHEFKCALADGRHYLLYVNAQTGQEEKILILLEDETGTLTV